MSVGVSHDRSTELNPDSPQIFVGAANAKLTSRARTAFDPMMVAVVMDSMSKHPATATRTQLTLDDVIT